MLKIMVVEDDADLKLLFCKTLEKASYEPIGMENAMEALKYLESHTVDLVISDVMMPGMNGVDFVRMLRENGQEFPIILITAKGEMSDKEAGFLAGADDYMVKPIDIHEMILRVNALLRRVKNATDTKMIFGGTELDRSIFTVVDEKGEQLLPQKEFQLLYKLLSAPGQIYTRQQIMDDIWRGNEGVDTHTLDVHISRLRERFKNNLDFEIVTIRGLGYRAIKKEKGDI